MHIAIIAPVELSVPPVSYGGTELVVSVLTEELVRRGQNVTLFATGDSKTNAKLVSVVDHSIQWSKHDSHILNMLNVLSCVEKSEKYDIIHNHTFFEGMSIAGLVRTPMLTTLHGQLESDWARLFQHYKGWYNTISYSMKKLLPVKDKFAGVVYNAIRPEDYPFNNGTREDYLLFFSRMSQEKGPHFAIQVAEELNIQLIMAGPVHPPDETYFHSQILPHVDGEMIQYLGEVDVETKKQLMRNARCLLAPITWPEPFGLFMGEALACGTPVVAFNRGAAAEIIEHNATGFVVDNVSDMVRVIPQVDKIDPQVCRRSVEEKFSPGRMADDYLQAYQRILLKESRMIPIVNVPTKAREALEI